MYATAFWYNSKGVVKKVVDEKSKEKNEEKISRKIESTQKSSAGYLLVRKYDILYIYFYIFCSVKILKWKKYLGVWKNRWKELLVKMEGKQVPFT